MSPTDPTPTNEELSQRVGELGSMLEGLAGDLARLIEMTSAKAESWLQVSDPQVAREMLDDLRGWLDAVYLRYPGTALRDCWAWHPPVIEELWWLRCAHAEAYSGRGWASRAGLWHHQQRPGVVERVKAMLGTCDLSRHVSGGQPPAAAPLAAHLDAVADAWTSTGLPPEPTEQQLQHAREYSDLLLYRPSA